MSGGDPSGWARPIAIGITGGALMFVMAARQQASRGSGAPPTLAPIELHVPRAGAAITIDGELDEPAWTLAPARTGGFLGADGTPARPFSDARLLWGDQQLYLALFAADEDVRVARVAADGPVWMGDSFSLLLTRSDGTTRTIDIGASGIITDGAAAPGTPLDYTWQSGARAAADVDGTLDKPDDRDEEWVVELALPLRSLGLTGAPGERIGLAIRRCDQGREETRRSCGFFGGPAPGSPPVVLVLD